MSGETMSGPRAEAAEEVLRADLLRADSVIAATRPVLRVLLAEGEQALFSDQVVARIRGMLRHCAEQLLSELAGEYGIEERTALIDRHRPALVASLLQDSGLLSHAQALTLESLRAERLQQRGGVDPVLTPLIQESCASGDEQVATLAMQVLAAQARFMQQQRRMELPLGELPGELFHRALLALRGCEGLDEAVAAACDQRLRRQFDEAERRENKIARLLLTLGRRGDRALAFSHAGLAVFVSALALATAQDRDLAVLALGENQIARLALSLRAAGQSPARVEEQLVYLHPDARLPAGLETISQERAAALLAATQARGMEGADG
jgi:hypothetical protein